ncbi:MAG: signal peptide peptidase SppA [Candidatus Marinimicrobia bacterium]|nr:signal peptide peptidase SppA [Candidatus Neomarinimicrobiota bacterium]
MEKKRSYSKWIAGGLLLLILLMIIPWKKTIPSGPKVGVVEINAPIMESKDWIQDLEYFHRESNISAIVVRLNTPGGGVAASQEVYEKVKKIAEENKKPVIASMGGMAASGGYYIALGADTIVANPGTATGSIGVIMSYPVVEDLLEKLGVDYETVKSAELKDSGSPFRGMNSREREYFQSLIDDLHYQFVDAVSEGRNMSREEAEAYANGKVYSGKQAWEKGLVDVLGTMEDAVELAAKLAGITGTPEIVYPPEEEKGLLAMIFGDILESTPWENLLHYPRPEYILNYKLR